MMSPIGEFKKKRGVIHFSDLRSFSFSKTAKTGNSKVDKLTGNYFDNKRESFPKVFLQGFFK